MRKGFSYIIFLILIFLVLTVIISLSAVLQNMAVIRQKDFNLLQAEWYALSAVEFYKTNPALPNLTQQKIDLQALKKAPGLVYPLGQGGFKIVRSKDILFFIGYKGESLAAAAALKILTQSGGKLYPWVE